MSIALSPHAGRGRWAAAYGVSADVVACEDTTVTYVAIKDIQAPIALL
jgi:hypothetical protein